MASKRFPTPPERVRFLPSVLCTPRSSSRPGSRSLTPVTRVRTPLGALSMRPWCQGRKHTALPALRTGFESRRSLSHGALGGQDGGLHPPERGSIPRGSTVLPADREPLPRFSIARIPEGVPCRGRNCRSVRGSCSRGSTRSRARLVVRLGCLPGEAGSTPVESARLVVAQRMEHHPATVGDGGSNPPGEMPKADIRGAALRPRSGRLQGCAPPQAGIRAADSARRGIALANKPRRQADWAGAALIRRSSVVRFHGRRSPRSSAEEQRASTPRVAGSSPAGEQELTGRRGDRPPHRLRASEIAGSNPADQIFALVRERRAVEERLSSRAS